VLVPRMSSVGAVTLTEMGENGMGSGRETGAGGVAGLARLDESPRVSTSTSTSSSMSQNEDGPSLLCPPLPSRAAKALTLLTLLTGGVMEVDAVREVRLDTLRRCVC